jgi:hypothetical protein
MVTLNPCHLTRWSTRVNQLRCRLQVAAATPLTVPPPKILILVALYPLQIAQKFNCSSNNTTPNALRAKKSLPALPLLRPSSPKRNTRVTHHHPPPRACDLSGVAAEQATVSQTQLTYRHAPLVTVRLYHFIVTDDTIELRNELEFFSTESNGQ